MKKTNPRKQTKRAQSKPAAKQPSIASELAKIRSVTGTDEVRYIKDDIWLLRLGTVVDLDIRRWRAQDSLTFQDLGLPEPKTAEERVVFADLMTLGTRRLLPPSYVKRLNSVDSGARKWLTQCSYKTRFGPFVDCGRYQAWRSGDLRFRGIYFSIRDEIERDWADICKWRNEQYALAGKRAFTQLRKLAPRSLVNEQCAPLSEGAFVAQYVTRALMKAPTREEVYASFGYNVQLSYIPLPSLLAWDSAESERIEAARALERIAENAILHGERARQLAVMHDDVTANSAANSPAVVQEFVRDLQVQCVSTILEKLDCVKASIGKNGDALVGKSAGQLKNALASYQAMNLVGHHRLDGKVTRLAEMMASAPNKRQLAAIETAIDEISTIAKQTLTALKLSAA